MLFPDIRVLVIFGRQWRTCLILVLFFVVALPRALLAEPEVTFHWSPSPRITTAGGVLPRAVSYEVWLTVADKLERLVASVRDTYYVLKVKPGIAFRLRVRGVDANGNKSPMSEFSEPYFAPGVSFSVPVLPAGLGPVYPNPFNPRTRISYRVPTTLADRALLQLHIFDARGRRLRTFALDRSPGPGQVTWDGRAEDGRLAPAGTYVAHYICGNFTSNLKLTLVR